LITNCSISAEQQAAIEGLIRDRGCREAVVLDRTWITAIVRERRRLRMLVPRIYGLGNITDLLDGEALHQSRAILSYLSADLEKLVVTAAHKKAAEAVLDHGFVMLLGAPRVGKSVIAATLALAALDNWGAETYLVRSVDEIVSHWRPDGPRQFFWLDDAFGTNQLEMDRIDAWNRTSKHIMTAIRGGAMVVCTARLHLFKSALPLIKTIEFPLLRNSQVLVEVENLSIKERENILYNHIRLGSTNRAFKQKIRPYLKEVAGLPGFAPELARWLGDETLRQGIKVDRESLRQFISEPVEHLKSVIAGLDRDSFAALAVIFAEDGELTLPIQDTDQVRTLLSTLGSSRHGVVSALRSMDESVVRQVVTSRGAHWNFRHPTMRDALAQLVAENPDLTSLYLTGVTTEHLLREVVCWGVSLHGASIALEPQYNDTLLQRLKELPLFAQVEFITRRASPQFAQLWLGQQVNLFDAALKLELPSYGPYETYLALAAALARLNVLPEGLRARWSSSVTKFLLDPDLEFLGLIETPSLDSLLCPDDAAAVDYFVREEFLGRIDRILENRLRGYDGETDPEAYLSDLSENLARIDIVIKLDRFEQKVLDAAISDIDYHAERLRERYYPRRDDHDDYDSYFSDDDHMASRASDSNPLSREANTVEDRDVFEDVDDD
jgi:hypothetical protein